MNHLLFSNSLKKLLTQAAQSFGAGDTGYSSPQDWWFCAPQAKAAFSQIPSILDAVPDLTTSSGSKHPFPSTWS